jgi:NADH-quinone oxidoreductase subunit I
VGFGDEVKDQLSFLGGFKLTFQHLTRPRVTTSYPDEKRPKFPRQHGRHVLNRYEDGMEKCIGCELCAGVCPADCIYVRGLDNPPDHPVSPGERYGYVYEINYLRCIHCDMCVEACPTEAITESKLFEFSFTNRGDAIYTKAELLVDLEGKPRHLPWEDWHDGDERNTSGWVRATAPAGNAAYEGRPLWSGELGHGVRPAQSGQSDPEAADVPADWDTSLRETGAAALKGVGVRTGRAHRAPAPIPSSSSSSSDSDDSHGGGGH